MTVIEKDNLVMEAMIQNNEVVLKKERTSKTRPKGKGWEYVQFEDDEYYYYVKAIPKNSVTKSKKTVKKITSVIDYRD